MEGEGCATLDCIISNEDLIGMILQKMWYEEVARLARANRVIRAYLREWLRTKKERATDTALEIYLQLMAYNPPPEHAMAIIDKFRDDQLAYWHLSSKHVLLVRSNMRMFVKSARVIFALLEGGDENALMFAASELVSNRKFLLDVIELSKRTTILHIRTFLKGDKDLTLVALGVRPYNYLSLMESHLFQDRDFVLKALDVIGAREPSFLSHIERRLREDKDVVLKAVNLCGGALCFAGTALRSDRLVVTAAVRQKPSAFLHANCRLRSSKNFIQQLVNAVSLEVLDYAVPALRDDSVFRNTLISVLDGNTQKQKSAPRKKRKRENERDV